MQILMSGALYFVLVFGTGFVLGTVRTLWVSPRFGTRVAELMETPLMLAITIVAARWTVSLHGHTENLHAQTSPKPFSRDG